MKVAVIIPAKDEEKRIGNIVSECTEFGDVFVVDDGSTDNTSEIARENGAKVLKLSKNKGKGFAMRVGVKKALEGEFDYFVFLDGDGQHEPKDIKNFIKKLKDYEIVLGQRVGGEMPFVKKIGNWGLHKIFKLFFNSDIEDTQCGFKAMRREVFETLTWKSDGYFVDTEIAAASSKFRVATVTIPTIYHDKYKGTTVKDGLIVGAKMIKLWFGKILEHFKSK